MSTVLPLRLAIIGAGCPRDDLRAREPSRPATAVVTAVAEPRRDRRAAAAAEFGVAERWSVEDWTELADPGRPRRRRRGGGYA